MECITDNIKIDILLKCTWNILQDRPYADHKTNLSEFKEIEIIQSVFSDHYGMKL